MLKLGNCIRRAGSCRSPDQRGATIAAGRRPGTISDLHELRIEPVRCMIQPSDGCDFRGWRAGWDGRNWRDRRAWSWCPGWCSCARRTRCSRRCCRDGAPSRPRGGCGATRSGRGSGWCAGSANSPASTRGSGRRAHMDEWSQHLTSEEHLAPSTVRSYQCTLRQFTEFLTDGRYGWATACEEEFGPGQHPVAICHEWNTIAHLNDYEGDPGGAAVHPRGDAAVPRLRRRAGGPGGEQRAEGGAGGLPGRDVVQGHVRVGAVLRGSLAAR